MLAEPSSIISVATRLMSSTPTMLVRYKAFLSLSYTHHSVYLTVDPLALLYPVPDATYDSMGNVSGMGNVSDMGNVSGCLEGTREEIIGRIVQWIEGNKPICWLNGAAGAGKSTISRTVAN